MASRRIRIYSGSTPDTNIIGFSMSAAGAPDEPGFQAFMSNRDYTTRHLAVTDGPPDGVSYRYVEVAPPLSLEHTQELGTLCIGGVIRGERVPAIIDTSHNGIGVYDNRAVPPREPYDNSGLIAHI